MPIVTVSSKGQIVIPRRIRTRLRLDQGAKVDIEISGRAALLRPVASARTGWRRWDGAFAGADLLRMLTKEHAAELRRRRQRGP